MEQAAAVDELNFLNPEQRKAASIIEGPALVIAGAGSGKTRVVTTRIVQLIKSGIEPSSILGVTFTNKAAQEMKERIRGLTSHQVLVCTFHSLGVRVLRESIQALGYPRDFIIYDEDDCEKLLRAIIAELGLKDKKIELKVFRQFISQGKNALKEPHQCDGEADFIDVYRNYQAKLKQYGAVDFDDLLYLTVRLWQNFPDVLATYQERWPFVLIDEYQDTNHAQYLLTKLLVARSHNLFVVGDPDQSIYSWRGANINNILDFSKDYPGAQVINLEQNYRSSTNILNAANALITRNSNRYEKNLWSELGEGEKIKLFIGSNEREEADFVVTQIRNHLQLGVPLTDIVVFYRTNAQSRAFEDLLLYRRIPYVIVGGLSFYQRREIKDIMAFLRIAQCPSDFISFLRTINIPKRGLGEASIEKLRVAADHEGIPIISYCEALVNGLSMSSQVKLSEKQRLGLTDYIKIIHAIKSTIQTGKVEDAVMAAIQISRYVEYMKEDPESFDDRKENLNALVAKAVEWADMAETPTLESFLEELSLKSSLDESNRGTEHLSLMTIHNGKGLEYKVTFLVGLEEGLFPHINSNDKPEGVEEERRLCYVGITRAKEHLYISCCQSRFLWGTFRNQRPSRFLGEIPYEFLERVRRPVSVDAPRPQRTIPTEKISNANFKVGDTVFHKDFGIGNIKELGESTMGATYKIFFINDKSMKTVVGNLAALKKL